MFHTKAAHSALLDAVHAVSDDTDKRVVIKRLMRLCAAHRRSELMEKLRMMKPPGLGDWLNDVFSGLSAPELTELPYKDKRAFTILLALPFTPKNVRHALKVLGERGEDAFDSVKVGRDPLEPTPPTVPKTAPPTTPKGLCKGRECCRDLAAVEPCAFYTVGSDCTGCLRACAHELAGTVFGAGHPLNTYTCTHEYYICDAHARKHNKRKCTRCGGKLVKMRRATPEERARVVDHALYRKR